jgi:hypothetical protein
MSHLPLARRVALLHPGFLSLIWFLFGTMPAAALLPPVVQSLALFSLICGWAWAIYVISIARVPQESHPAWTRWIFLAPPALVVAAAIGKLPTVNSPIAVLVLGTLFLALWRAAQALEYADKQEKPVTAGRIAGTMFLMFFSIVGFWWLRQRIVRVAASSSL